MAREQGSALILALVSIMIIVMVSGALVAATQRTRATNKTRGDRVAGLGPADAGLSTYRFGLQSGVITDTTTPKWVPTGPQLTQILDSATGATGTVLRNSEMGPYAKVDPSMPPASQVTVRELRADGDSGVYDYWQIYRVQQPDAALGKDLKVWFRAWTAGASMSNGSSNARMVIGTFRQGHFSDFQMLSNGPIRFQDGSSILGPVHSNGDRDGVSVPPANVPPDATVFADPAANITCPPGGATVTTGSGTVSLPSSCRLVGDGQPTGRFISFQGLQHTFTGMLGRCTGDVLCCTTANCRADAAGTYQVSLSGRTITIGGTATALDNPDGTPRYNAVLFDRNVVASGISKGRLTIAAYNGQSGGSSATITIRSDIGTQVNSATNTGSVAGESLGIFAQGDIVVDPATCPRLVHGVMISGSGMLTIGRGLMTSSPPSPMPANGYKCAELILSGAVASNTAPTLNWTWPALGNLTVGYLKRTYVWDKSLRKSPPPFTPTTGTWEVAEWHDADASCTNDDLTARPQNCE